jgi:hypothetical protein
MAVTETVKIVFEVDDKQVTDSVTELAKLGKVSQEDAAKFKQLGDASKAAGASMSTAAKGAKELSTATADIGKSAVGIKDTATNAQAAADGFIPLRTRLKEAKLELQQLSEEFGPFSAQANAARARAGELSDEFADLNRQVNLLNPDGKIAAFNKLGQGVVGAFSVATGALQAFGAENEQVQKVAQQLQGALNIAQGIQSIVGLKEAYEDVKAVLGFTTAAQTALTTATTTGTVATEGAAVATRGFAAALTATGIGAIVVALGALAGAFLLLRDTEESEAETKKKNKEAQQLFNEKLKEEIDLIIQRKNLAGTGVGALERELQLAEARGVKGRELFELQQKVRKAELEDLKLIAAAAERGGESETNRIKAAEAVKDKTNEIAASELAFKRQTYEDGVEAYKEAEDKRLKALQDNQASIDAAYAAEQARRQQFEQELQSQLSDIDKAGQSERLQNQVIFFGDQQAISEENLVSEIRQQQQRIDKLKDFNQQDTQAYKDALAQKALLDKEYIKLKETNDQKALDEARANNIIANTLKAKDDKELLQLNNATQQQFLEDSVNIYKQGTEERKKAEQNLALFLKELRAADAADAKKTEQEKADAQKERIDKAFTLANEATDIIIQENQRQNEAELESLEQSREQGLISEEAYQVKLKQIKRKSAEDAKKAQIFQATMNAAQAILSALATFYPDPASKIAAVAFASALGALNLAKVIATPIPKFKQGTLAVPGHDTGDDSVMAMLRPGEAVIPTETNREYAAVIRAIYTKKVSANELNEFVTSRDKRVSKQQLIEFMNSRNLTTFNEIYNSRNTTQTDRNEAKFYKYFDTERVIKSKQNTEVQLEPVFTFNPVTMEALFKRDLKVSNFNNTVVKRTGGDMPTIKVKADVDTQQLTRAMAKNKAVELSNSQVLAKALAQEIAKTHNPRRQ